MIAVALGGLSLLVGAALALAFRTHALRAAAALVSQSIACALVLGAGVGVMQAHAAVGAQWAWSYPLEVVRVRLDPLSAFFLAWSLPMTLLGTLYAVGYLANYVRSGRNAGAHFALLNLVALSFILIYTAENALIFLFGWEVAAVSAWLLVIWDYKNQKVRFAGFNYLVSTHVGLFVLLAAFMIMHSQTGSMHFADFVGFLARPGTLRDVVFVLLVVAAGLKSAFFPFHTWLPRAHAAAPAHVSALMSGVIHKAGLFALLRFVLAYGDPEPWMGWFLLGFSALSALVGVVYTSTQRDLKRLLGYSSTENVGIAGMAFGLGTLGLAWHRPTLVALGFTAGLLHVFNHALFKCLLFYAAGAVQRAAHTVDLERLGGLARRMPRTAAFFLLGSLAIAALPPFNGFVSEFLLYAGLLGDGTPPGMERAVACVAAAVLALVGAVSALSITRAFGLGFLGQPRDASVHIEEGDAPWTMALPMALHAVGVVTVGLLPSVGIAIVAPAVGLFVANTPAAGVVENSLALLAPLRTMALVLLGVTVLLLVATRAARRRARTHVTWGCGYTEPTARMQYSGSSFSAQIARVFEALVRELRREKLPRGYFPQADSHVSTHHADAVERRMFEALGNGESFVRGVSEKIPEEPRFAFAAGLLALVIIVALLVRGGS